MTNHTESTMMTKREITLKEIKEAADKFFEYPTADKSHVSTTSMILFVEHMLNRAEKQTAESTASDAWSELDEKRVDVVGQNGNDGLHYE